MPRSASESPSAVSKAAENMFNTHGPMPEGAELLLGQHEALLSRAGSLSVPTHPELRGRMTAVFDSRERGLAAVLHWRMEKDGIVGDATRAFTIADLEAANPLTDAEEDAVPLEQPELEQAVLPWSDSITRHDPVIEPADALVTAENDMTPMYGSDDTPALIMDHPVEGGPLFSEEDVVVEPEESAPIANSETAPSSEVEEGLVNAYDMLRYLANSTTGSPHERDINIVHYIRTVQIEDAPGATPASRAVLESMAAGIVRDPVAVEEASRSFLGHFNETVAQAARSAGGKAESAVRDIQQQLHSLEGAWISGRRVPVEDAYLFAERYLKAIDSESEPLTRTALVCGLFYTAGMLKGESLHIGKRLADRGELAKVLRAAL